MAHKHDTRFDNKVYGKLHSDEEFTVRVHHITKLISQGYPVNWYRDKFNRLRVLRNNKWWIIDELAKHEELYNWER